MRHTSLVPPESPRKADRERERREYRWRRDAPFSSRCERCARLHPGERCADRAGR